MDKHACDFCGWDLFDADELTPGPSGDPCCSDCHTTHADTRTAHAY
ncbi:MAG: hypothetical protein ACJ768_11795 [Gaiellaceae bacterium]|jgi:hypothetical protein